MALNLLLLWLIYTGVVASDDSGPQPPLCTKFCLTPIICHDSAVACFCIIWSSRAEHPDTCIRRHCSRGEMGQLWRDVDRYCGHVDSVAGSAIE
ncbi:hypothetical protein CDD81_1623 [Ophiocordyceps australis]|uniref:Extracellular membrane protein CFEM domain-containing protein n=1 Tax=Ophiocordyceps australis TaxID=1399860 RepID=A0A2C5XZU5_9HYPO|nr:hypothetical protein CDD81_1623 [Ophiocordyceps australis]